MFLIYATSNTQEEKIEMASTTAGVMCDECSALASCDRCFMNALPRVEKKVSFTTLYHIIAPLFVITI